MPLEKQSLNNFLPDGFETLNQEGYKTNFSEDKIKTGYEKDIKDRVSGPNLNNLIDVVGKNTNTLNNYVEYLNGMPINNVPTTDENGQLNYINLDDKLTKKQITNCILEIPQRIKYTLEDGTLTIKAGSVVIVPYGVEDLTSQYPKGATFIHENFKVYDTQFADGKFFVWAEIQDDIIRREEPNDRTWNLFIALSSNSTSLRIIDKCYDGESAPTIDSTDYAAWYDRYNNKLLLTINAGATWQEGVSLPLGHITSLGGIINSFSQVFNGFGYIGSTIWADKGIKCLIPNGRNEDGTLKNIEFVTSRFTMATVSGTKTESLRLGSDQIRTSAFVYDGESNFNYLKPITPSNKRIEANVGTVTVESSTVVTFQPKKPFRAVDYNEASGLGMPSNKYIDLTLGANLSKYTAPANGWFTLRKTIGSTNPAYIYLVNESNGICTEYSIMGSGLSSYESKLYLPVRKGDVVTCGYNITGSITYFRFIYAEGEI